jgi:CheY-like chemotaxis protein
VIEPSKRVILVIEDEEDVLSYIRAVLIDRGYEVLEARDGEQGLKLLRERRPHLVTLDINLPEKTGVRFYRELRQDADLRSTPVVMVTGLQPEFREFIEHRRAVPPPEGYVPKPFTAEELMAAIEGAMAKV